MLSIMVVVGLVLVLGLAVVVKALSSAGAVDNITRGLGALSASFGSFMVIVAQGPAGGPS